MSAFLISMLLILKVSCGQIIKHCPMNILQTYHKITDLAMDSGFTRQCHQVKRPTRLNQIHHLEWTETCASVDDMVVGELCLV